MSAILTYANTRTAIIAGDSRKINKFTNEILSDTYKKIRKINNSIIIGFAGDASPCEKILESIINDKNISDYHPEDLAHKIEKESSEYPPNQKIMFTVCGIGKKKEIYAAIIAAHEKTYIYYPTESKPFYCILFPKEVPKNSDFYKEMLQSKKTPLEAMKATIKFCSTLSPSVNDTITYECINLN